MQNGSGGRGNRGMQNGSGGRGGNRGMQNGSRGRVIARGGGGRGTGISPMNRGHGGGLASKDALDRELDSYMLQNKKTHKAVLDREMDDYMRARDQQQAGPSTSVTNGFTHATPATTAIANGKIDEDVNMSEV